MRYVDISQMQISARWTKRAVKALGKVAVARPTQRKQAAEIEKRKKIWSALKPVLSRITDNKCWYCEAKDPRFDKVVDHFRPKNGVEEDPSHTGYWWLAFTASNYRLACDYCNCLHPNDAAGRPLGKQTHFPLSHGGCRANTVTDGLDLEKPLLLDPICESDTRLLKFHEAGHVEPTNLNSSSNEYLRAKTSIEIYNLNDPDTVFRRAELVAEVKDLIVIADALAQVNDRYESQFERAKALIAKKVKWSAEFSTLTNTIANEYVDSDRPWLADLLRVANTH